MTVIPILQSLVFDDGYTTFLVCGVWWLQHQSFSPQGAESI